MAGSAAAAANLEDVPSLDLMSELLRRMKCSDKPDKRLILIGLSHFLLFHFLSLHITSKLRTLFCLCSMMCISWSFGLSWFLIPGCIQIQELFVVFLCWDVFFGFLLCTVCLVAEVIEEKEKEKSRAFFFTVALVEKWGFGFCVFIELGIWGHIKETFFTGQF